MSPAVRLFYEIVLLLMIVGSGGFLVHYSLVYPWWRNEYGRHIVAFSGVVTAFLIYFLIFTFFPQLPWRTPIRLTLFVILGVVIWQRWFVFVRTRKRERVERVERA